MIIMDFSTVSESDFIKYCVKNIPAFLLDGLRMASTYAPDILVNEAFLCAYFKYAKEGDFSIQYLSEKMRAVPEIAERAIELAPNALKYLAHTPYPNNREIVLGALAKDGSALCCVSEELRDDFAVVYVAATSDKCSTAFFYACSLRIQEVLTQYSNVHSIVDVLKWQSDSDVISVHSQKIHTMIYSEKITNICKFRFI